MKISKRINEHVLQKQKENNKDPYGGACVKVAENVLDYLDEYEGDEFNLGYSPDMSTPHGIICHCDDQGGITGFQASAATNIVLWCHELGWKFWLADMISIYEVDKPERLKKVVDNLMKAEELDIDRDEAEAYVQGLVDRYKAKKKAKED